MIDIDKIECVQCGKHGYKWGRPWCIYCGYEIEDYPELKERLNRIKLDRIKAEEEHDELKKKMRKEKLNKLLDRED